MIEWNLLPEWETASAAVTRCHLEHWRAKEDVRRAAEMLRQAIRAVDETEHAVAQATRRLNSPDSSINPFGDGTQPARLALMR
jgi:hypothetical protein